MLHEMLEVTHYILYLGSLSDTTPPTLTNQSAPPTNITLIDMSDSTS